MNSFTAQHFQSSQNRLPRRKKGADCFNLTSIVNIMDHINRSVQKDHTGLGCGYSSKKGFSSSPQFRRTTRSLFHWLWTHAAPVHHLLFVFFFFLNLYYIIGSAQSDSPEPAGVSLPVAECHSAASSLSTLACTWNEVWRWQWTEDSLYCL